MKHDKLQESERKAVPHSIEESDDICREACGNSPDSLQDVLNDICIRTNHKVSTAKSFPFNEDSEGKKYQSQLEDWNYKYVVFYISLKHEGANKVHLINMKSKIAAARRADSIDDFTPCWGGFPSFPSSPSIYTSGAFSKNTLFCTKREIPHISVVSHHWSGIVTPSLLTKPPNCTASVPHKTTAQTTTYTCSASTGGVLFFLTGLGGSFTKWVLFCLLITFSPFTIFGFGCFGIWV